jgi:hypothetical protein
MEDHDRVFILHPANIEPLKPVEKWQSVPTTREHVSEFLQDIYGKPPVPGMEPLNSKLVESRELLEGLAEDICQTIKTSNATAS